MAHILVVDDSPSAIAAIEAVMGADGHSVCGVTSFVEVVSAIHETIPDVILLDLSLPAISGRAIGAFVRKFQAAPIPILIYSSQSPSEIEEATKELDAVGSVPKGLAPDELRRCFRAALARVDKPSGSSPPSTARADAPPADETAHQILRRVRARYTGATGDFIVSRLSLRTGIDLSMLRSDDRDPAKAAKLREAVRDICPELER